jgi:glucose/arabinose dehydrogenase/PKD repeat protein
MLVTEKAGRLLVVRGTERTVALDIRSSICDQGERGLLGVAVDPDFDSNHFIYLYYSHKVAGACGGGNKPFPQSRVGRFVVSDDDKVDAAAETVIVDHLVSPEVHHLAGDLEFGVDGFLYISVGDGICSLRHPTRCGPTNDNALARNVPLGKILRVDRDGLPAPDNPYVDDAGSRRCTRPAGVEHGKGPCQEVFALGLRNPFRFARMPDTSTFYVNDVGLDTWEEVDKLRRGGNYGWNIREGHCARASTTRCGKAPGFINPIFDYHHSRCRSITGGAFVPNDLWPGFNGSYLYADFACNKIFRLRPAAGGGFTHSTLLGSARGPTHLRFGPYQDGSALYYASFFGNEIRRVVPAAENTPPVAELHYRPDGRVVDFDGKASSDPEGQKITAWHWSFGDGSSKTTTGPRVTHTYATTGTFQATLTVTDSGGLESSPSTMTVYSGEHAPSVTITSPPPDRRFHVGQTVNLSAVADDQEDGSLPGSSMVWTVRLHHANHFHPQAGPVTGASLSTSYPPPEELPATTNSFLVATLKVTDSHGISTKVKQQLLPKLVRLKFDSAPHGARVVIGGERRTTATTVTSWAGYVFPVRARDQNIRGHAYTFSTWSDGGAQSHDITTPGTAHTYVARFVRS